MDEEKGKSDSKLVLPGDFIEDLNGRKTGEGVYTRDEKAYSEVIGIVRSGMYEVSVIPMAKKYIPEFGDKVVGVVKEVDISGWRIDINAPYIGYLPISEATEEFIDSRTDISKYFDKDDVIFCRISRVTKNKSVQCSMRDALARKLEDGIIINVTPSKISRIIGKGGSMINLIKEKTKTDVYTGQNGSIWVRGEGQELAVKAIQTIDKESHMGGLTEKIEKMLGGG